MDQLELSILKTLITNKKQAVEFVNDYDSKIFSPQLWNTVKQITSYITTYKEPPTLNILKDKLAKNPKAVETISTVWAAIDNAESNDNEFKYNLDKLTKRYIDRQILEARDFLISIDESNIDQVKTLAEIQRKVQDIKSFSKSKAYIKNTLKDYLPTFKEEYTAKLKDPTFDRGIKTGYSAFDDATDGIRPAELILVGGESGAGKSMLLMNLAVQLWMQNNDIDSEELTPGNSVIYFSLEMPFKACLNRVLANIAGIPSKKIRNASLDADQMAKLKKGLKFISKFNSQFEIVDSPRGTTMEVVEAIYGESKINFDSKIVVIDYLGLMEYQDGKEMDDWLKLGKISEKMHEFARVHNCTVLSAVQLNRAKGKESEDRIGMHRIGRSALIMTNANIAIQIESRPNESQYPDMIYHFIKNRDGELKKGTLIKDLACGKLVDMNLCEPDDEFIDRDPMDISNKLLDF